MEQEWNCQPWGNSPGSAWRACGGRWPRRSECQLGHVSKPSVLRRIAASLASCRHGGASVVPASAWTKVVAREGVLEAITGRVSAHAAQYAAGAVRLELRKPRPPIRAGRDATDLASSSCTRSWAPSMAQKVCQIEMSWAAAHWCERVGGGDSEEVVGARDGGVEKESPGAL